MTVNSEQPGKEFIDEAILVEFRQAPLLQKVPKPPDFFTWRGKRYEVKCLLSEWSDLARRGNQAKNMRPAHLTRAEKMGSWGVGRFFFKMRTTDERIFVIYYDRTPKKGDEGCGSWVLLSELTDNRAE